MYADILFALWFFLPAALANVAPILVARLHIVRRWNAPLDSGRTYHGRQILGPHKTWRGLVSGLLVATLTFWLQQLAVRQFDWAQSIAEHMDYAMLPALLVGPLFGLGALGGDAIKSFFKRRRGVHSGGTWVPFDQLDYIIGGALAVAPFIQLRLVQYVWILAIWFVIHLISSYVGWLLGLKARPI